MQKKIFCLRQTKIVHKEVCHRERKENPSLLVAGECEQGKGAKVQKTSSRSILAPHFPEARILKVAIEIDNEKRKQKILCDSGRTLLLMLTRDKRQQSKMGNIFREREGTSECPIPVWLWQGLEDICLMVPALTQSIGRHTCHGATVAKDEMSLYSGLQGWMTLQRVCSINGSLWQGQVSSVEC